MKNNKLKSGGLSRLFVLSEADVALFAEIKLHSVSEAERKFFSKLEWKEQYESAYANELLVYEKDNEDGVFLLRRYFDVYLIGSVSPEGIYKQVEFSHLAEALECRLDVTIGLSEPLTLLQWLRKYDFKFVRYDRNYDNC